MVHGRLAVHEDNVPGVNIDGLGVNLLGQYFYALLFKCLLQHHTCWGSNSWDIKRNFRFFLELLRPRELCRLVIKLEMTISTAIFTVGTGKVGVLISQLVNIYLQCGEDLLHFLF